MGTYVTFDTANRLVALTKAPVAGVVTINTQVDLYSDMKEDMVAPSDVLAANPPPFLVSQGGFPTATGATGDQYFLNNGAGAGWRIQPYDADHECYIVGNLLLGDNSRPWFVPRSGRTIVMSREFSNLSSQEVVETGVSGLTAAESTTHSLINDIWGQLGTIEGSASHKMMMRVLFAATCGKLDMTDHGDGTYTMHMRDMMDGKDRITFTGPIEGGRDTASWDMS